MWSIKHTQNKCFFCNISNHWWIHDLNCKLHVAVICKGSEWLRNTHLWFASGDLTLLCICRALALQRVTALSSIHQPTFRTWEKVSEGRAVRVDCWWHLDQCLCFFVCVCVCKGLCVLGSQRVLASAKGVAEERGTEIVCPRYCYVFDFHVESGDGAFIFPWEGVHFSFIV